ncbi:hypothetical protein [Citromicrobium sp. WPS32]|uniref:phage integrase central domain-containing protein n=1 Tax=Citromicrobium sp. WPS32 TaxID=1634517 RepID=UPI0006C922A3|nr:hypothetical protein [Citromicrobium sp. WPS32]MAY78752.1 hypothetical protein [Citromicrobium sp.]
MHANDVITSLERDVFPHLGAMPLADIDKPLLLSVLRKVEERGAIETARRIKQRVAAIYRYAFAEFRSNLGASRGHARHNSDHESQISSRIDRALEKS